MTCPNGHNLDQEVKIGQTKVDRCSVCQGFWFDKDELRVAEDSQADYIKWFNDELWGNLEDFSGQVGTKLCPKDNMALYSINYADSGVQIDACQKCHGVWLDKEEFVKLVEWLKGKSSYELLHHYFKSLLESGKEVVSGPDDLKTELHNFMIVLNLLNFRLVAGSPMLANFLISLPLTPEL